VVTVRKVGHCHPDIVLAAGHCDPDIVLAADQYHQAAGQCHSDIVLYAGHCHQDIVRFTISTSSIGVFWQSRGNPEAVIIVNVMRM
jgi:hypothetical protein